MAPKFIPFEEVEALATIEQLAHMLSLDIKRSGTQYRCDCPVHGGERSIAISPQVRSRRGSLGVFYCQQDKSGGDRIGLVAHCMELGQQDAAYFIASQFGMEVAKGTVDSDSTSSEKRATVPQKQEGGANRPANLQKSGGLVGSTPEPIKAFDPQAFSAKLTYTDEVAALGFSEEDAERFQVGVYRGKLYVPLRWPDGSIAAFLDFANGKLGLPQRARWLDAAPANVVKFPKSA